MILFKHAQTYPITLLYETKVQKKNNFIFNESRKKYQDRERTRNQNLKGM